MEPLQQNNNEEIQDTQKVEDSTPIEEQPTENQLQNWWQTFSFEGKHWLSLNEQGMLFYEPVGNIARRELAKLEATTAEATLNALTEKFAEVKAKVDEYEQEWHQQADKMKMAGKLHRLKDYLQHAKAIGDFSTLQTRVKEWDSTIQQLSKEHLAVKEKIVQEAEALLNESNLKEATQKLKDLTEQWKNAGSVDKDDNETLLQRFEVAKNNFYEKKRKAQEDLEAEMMQNLDLKLELVEKAEKLASSEEWKKTTAQFLELMEEWKRIGRTLPEKNEELWNRFIQAKNVFFDKKKENFLHIQQEQEQNLAAKLALVEQAEAIKDSEDWVKTAQQYSDIMEEWKKIGKVPLENADEIWKRLSEAKDVFYNRKRAFFETRKVAFQDNVAQKTALVNRAEAIQDSIQWRETTEELNELMEEWKKIGPVPREQGNKLWARFLAARKHFFNRKDEDRDKKKARITLQKQLRDKHAADTVIRMEDEYADEQQKLKDFKEALNNITPGPKAAELKAHLENLIDTTEKSLAKKEEKLNAIKQQYLEKAKPEQDNQTTTSPSYTAEPNVTTHQEVDSAQPPTDTLPDTETTDSEPPPAENA